uniref:Uncharacterized protein n=1 Tax=Chromera velia CCMP2878 TaxID=1169474 RepID=A0A0G4HVP5_9ALVE|eukprot:Cvel_8894.t1-p1 / transcript=Cvel_8894.t1 / gene=Cvel_8894 / organism=Chromera_velia_CCMP2878 / gene_product=hypothetical protein / transcript_product=hypothetical protein / location=Cvel_scaffold500:61874-65080(+) / protein_length=318 / sequence_SO=supercontig / SO=protein_coding / is_pseudo=false
MSSSPNYTRRSESGDGSISCGGTPGQIRRVEKIVHVPKRYIQEKIRYIPKIITQEREVRVPKIITRTKIVEVPHVQYIDKPVEKIVEVPQVHIRRVEKVVKVPVRITRHVPIVPHPQVVHFLQALPQVGRCTGFPPPFPATSPHPVPEREKKKKGKATEEEQLTRNEASPLSQPATDGLTTFQKGGAEDLLAISPASFVSISALSGPKLSPDLSHATPQAKAQLEPVTAKCTTAPLASSLPPAIPVSPESNRFSTRQASVSAQEVKRSRSREPPISVSHSSASASGSQAIKELLPSVLTPPTSPLKASGLPSTGKGGH